MLSPSLQRDGGSQHDDGKNDRGPSTNRLRHCLQSQRHEAQLNHRRARASMGSANYTRMGQVAQSDETLMIFPFGSSPAAVWLESEPRRALSTHSRVVGTASR